MRKLQGISVVIATKGRVKLLENLLVSVKTARENFDGPSEVLLVDDSSPEDAARIEQICREQDARRIAFGPSVAMKRNVGADAAQYDIILFLDSDCVATPNLLNEHYQLYTDEKVGGVAGPLVFVGEDKWFWHVVEKTPFIICFSFPQWMDTVPWTPTANCSMRKDVFQEIHGFDRTFPDKPGGEDVDLGLRMIKRGYVFRCTKTGLVYHNKATWSTPKAMFRRLWYYGSANYYVARNHPDYVMKIMPRRAQIFAFMLLMTILASIIRMNPLLLIAWPVWLILDTALMAVFINAFARYKGTTFLKQFCVQLLILDNEAGYVFRCIHEKAFSLIGKDVVYFDGQMDGILDNGAIGVWEQTISCVALCLFLALA